MFIVSKDIMNELEKDFKKYLVASYLIKNTDFKTFEILFTYSSTLEDLKASGLTEKKLRNIMKQLEEEGYIEWVYKSNTKHKPSVLKNLASEKIASEQDRKAIKLEKFKKMKATRKANSDIEEIWSLYPNKRGKAYAVKKIEKLLQIYSKEELIRAVERYKKEKEDAEMKYIKYGSTFFDDGYLDYIDENYQQLIKEEEERKKE